MYLIENSIFFAIHRNMSSSVVKLIVNNGGQYLPKLNEGMEKLFKFTIIREPIERFISGCIMMKIKDVKEFINEGDFQNNHVKPQHKFLPMKMDKYYIFENMEELPLNLGIPEHNHKSGSKTKIRKQLTPYFIKKLKQIYKEDYKLYETYATTATQRNN